MKKSFIFSFLMAIFAIAMTGCRTTPQSALSVTPPSLRFKAAGESKDIEITSNVLWTISELPEWIEEVSPSSGKGNATVKVKASANATAQKREKDKFKITAADVPVLTVDVYQDESTTVDISEIRGIKAPAVGVTPASKIDDTEQYVGKVTWSPTGAFAAGTAYTATITLTAEPGYTLEGVPINFFDVAGATSVTNAADRGVITATFPTIPNGTTDHPFLVATVADLQKVGTDVDDWTLSKRYRQTANINLKDVANWTPIGNNDTRFTGVYDGGGYSIDYLKIPSTNTEYQGLFGVIGASGEVRNVSLREVKINSTVRFVGAIASHNNGTIENCYATGELKGLHFVGGVSGVNFKVIKNCYTTCVVEGIGAYVGGISGQCGMGGKIERCYATGIISGTNYIGGIVGENIISDAIVELCVALNSKVSASDGDYVGRIAFNNTGTSINNYARSDMKLFADGVQITPITPEISGNHGDDVEPDDYHGERSGTWWNSSSGVRFSLNNWDFANNRLPHLKTTAGKAFAEEQTPAVN